MRLQRVIVNSQCHRVNEWQIQVSDPVVLTPSLCFFSLYHYAIIDLKNKSQKYGLKLTTTKLVKKNRNKLKCACLCMKGTAIT